jgi:hypothetical protein
MTVVPLPDTPCVRVRLIYTETSTTEAGSRFYLSYSGSAPTAANCGTLASDIAAAWASHLAPLPTQNWALTEVDVLDIATDSGAFGTWNGNNVASGGTEPVPKNCAINVEYDIGRRYRGGKPRMFLPAGNQTQLVDMGHWQSSFITSVNTGVSAFFTAIEALSVGSMGTLAHVNLSYYKGFTNITNSSGRERAVPTYRDTALHDVITGYSCKGEVGSQRRRRLSTTP